MKIYNKLVRDKIPEIIAADGKQAHIRILSKDDYILSLELKLNEEVKEYQLDKNIEELADILEVLYSLCIAKGWSLEDLEKTRKEKEYSRGGFKKRLFLERVD